jgi:uncharacterized damage-inducible protein DinB
MSKPPDLMNVLLDSWDRNNTILINLLNAVPKDAWGIRPMESSPSVAELFSHIHYVRLILIEEDVPELSVGVPKEEWVAEPDRERMSQLLTVSARAVHDAVQSSVESRRDMALHYDHPILFLQHMIWHEGYHHGQIKLALKLAGHPISDEVAGPISWSLWMKKSG